MKIAVAHINTTTGDVRGNLRLALRQAEWAAAEGADLLVLPAWALSGWQPQDLAFLMPARFSSEESRMAAAAAGGETRPHAARKRGDPWVKRRPRYT